MMMNVHVFFHAIVELCVKAHLIVISGNITAIRPIYCMERAKTYAAMIYVSIHHVQIQHIHYSNTILNKFRIELEEKLMIMCIQHADIHYLNNIIIYA